MKPTATMSAKLTDAQRTGLANLDARMKANQPRRDPSGMKPKVKDFELYFCDNGRVCCGCHLGMSARYTYRDISGQRIQRVTPRAAAAWLADVGSPIDCETCSEVADRAAAKYAPPTRILFRSEAHWGGKGTRGVHVCVVEMRLECSKVSGPQYVTTRIVSDEGGPPINPHSPPTKMGVAWEYIADQISRGAITVIKGAS